MSWLNPIFSHIFAGEALGFLRPVEPVAGPGLHVVQRGSACPAQGRPCAGRCNAGCGGPGETGDRGGIL